MSHYKYRNQDLKVLKRIQAEFEDYVGRETKIEGDTLTVFDRPQKKFTPKAGEDEKRPQRVTKAERETGYIPRD